MEESDVRKIMARISKPRTDRFGSGWAQYPDGRIGFFLDGRQYFSIMPNPIGLDPQSQPLKKIFGLESTYSVLGCFQSKSDMAEHLRLLLRSIENTEEIVAQE